MNLNNSWTRLIIGFILFFIIGSLSSCKTSHIQHNTITPNNQIMNEGEWIKYKKYHG